MDDERRQRFIAYFMGPPLHGDRKKLQQRTGYTKGRITQFLDDEQSFGEQAARNVARKLGLPDDAFERKREDGWTNRQRPPEGVSIPTVAHGVSYLQDSNVIPRMTWEGLVDLVPESLFVLRLRDDALSPGMARGVDVVWDRRRAPQPGKPVVIVDAHGRYHARFFEASADPEKWRATSTASGYPAFDQDNAKVVAVYRGVLDTD